MKNELSDDALDRLEKDAGDEYVAAAAIPDIIKDLRAAREVIADILRQHASLCGELERMEEQRRRLTEEVNRLRGVLEDISMSVSMSMPLEWSDEVSWYRSQFQSCIGKAARGLRP